MPTLEQAEKDALNFAIDNHQAGTVYGLLRDGIMPDSDAVDRAVRAGSGYVLEAVLSRGVSEIKRETLQCAVDSNQSPAVSQLIRAGAVPDGDMLDDAIRHRSGYVVDALWAVDIKPRQETLEFVVRHGQSGRADRLIRAGAVPTGALIELARNHHEHRTAHVLRTWLEFRETSASVQEVAAAVSSQPASSARKTRRLFPRSAR